MHLFVYIFEVSCPAITDRPWLTLAASSEVLFFISVLPKRLHLQSAPPKTGFRTHYERDDLFYKCCEYVPSLEKFLSNWFQGASVEELHRDDVKDFLAWTFANKSISFEHYDCELDRYITHMEGVLGRTFPPGRGCHQAMRLSLDPLHVQHKPLVYYLVRQLFLWSGYALEVIRHTWALINTHANHVILLSRGLFEMN